MKKPPKPDILSPEDLRLWNQVLKTVSAYETAEKKSAPRSGARKKMEPAAPNTTGRREPPPPSPAPPRSLDRATERKLKAGRLLPEGRLDLHGMTQEKAYSALQDFISEASGSGKRNLLVITGKGGRGAGGPGILRQMLPLWLERNPLVLALHQAQPRDGGAGAFYLRLRKKGR